jgi:hypothetical protein
MMEIHEGIPKTQVQQDDLTLWKELQAGSDKAFSLLYQRYFFTLYDYGITISQERDVVKLCIKELFVYLWNHNEYLPDINDVSAYLHQSIKRRLVAIGDLKVTEK